jgi:phenylacetate-CoA ligase
MRKIIKYSYNNIPGYKKKFDEANVKPEDIKTTEDLWKIPITTRQELQNNEDFVNMKLISDTLYTGGSTGTSLKYYESAESGRIRWNAHIRGWSWNGYTIGKRLAVIASAQGLVKEENTINLIGDFTTENLNRNVEKIFDFKPQHLRGYVGSLFILAKYCLDNNIKLDGIESINPISENLYDYQRDIMEEAFNCKVFEEYCCNDGGACAWECEAHEGLHYFMERAIIEDADGEMVVTDIWNRAMPFIRYKNGDSIKFLNKSCSCGRELPLIEVKGRANDTIISPKGLVGATFLMRNAIRYDKEFKSGIRTVQYIQKPGYILEINLVKNNWCTDKEIEEYKNDLRYIVGDMVIKIHFVETIPRTKKGKTSFIINEDKELLEKMGLYQGIKCVE